MGLLCPSEMGLGSTATLEVLQHDVNGVLGESSVDCISGRPLREPLVDYQRSVEEESDPVVYGNRESVCARRRQVNQPRPARREVVHANAGAGAAVAEVEIEETSAIVAHYRRAA